MMLLAALVAGWAVWLCSPPGASPPRRTTSARWCPPRLGVLAAGLGVWVVVTGRVPGRTGVVAVAGAAALGGAWLIWRRRRDRQLRERTALGVLEACEVMAAELTAGRPPGYALEAAAGRWPDLAPVVEACSLGSDVPGALRRLAASPGAGDLRVLAAAWQVAHSSGHGLAHAVSRVSDRIRAQRRTQRVVVSELASARATARLVALLPVIALAMGSGAGGDPWNFLLGTPLGWCCLGSGLALGVLGLWWIEAIADQVEAG